MKNIINDTNVTEWFSQQMANLTPMKMVLALLMGFIVGLIIALVYRKAFRGVLFSPSFANTLIMLCMITTPVVMCIKSNIALSMGMVGALSIVRFRTAIKDPLDTAYMFWSLTMGILLGAELYTIALVVVAGISIAMLALAFFRLRTPNTFLLVTHYDAEVEPEVMDFIRRIKVQRLRSKTVTPGGVELTVEVQLRERFDIVNKLMDTEGVHNATLIACQSEAVNKGADMIIRNIPLRHELKYLITPAELTVLRNALAPLMQLDQGHEYLIRSLYFDTINDDALEEKIAGVGNRKKYRIRIYNFSDRVIKLECKSKYGDLISKQSVSIPRELADQLIAGDPEGLQRMRHPLLHDVYREMKTRLLRPVVIVDYVREAYIHPAEEVRITFDKQIRTGLYQTNMFDAAIPTYPVFDDPVEVLEVKYDEFLPTYMQAILSGVTAQRSAVSKYTWCRRYENKEF